MCACDQVYVCMCMYVAMYMYVRRKHNKDVHLRMLPLLRGGAQLPSGDHLFPRPHPQDGAVVTNVALGKAKAAEWAPGESEA